MRGVGSGRARTVSQAGPGRAGGANRGRCGVVRNATRLKATGAQFQADLQKAGAGRRTLEGVRPCLRSAVSTRRRVRERRRGALPAAQCSAPSRTESTARRPRARRPAHSSLSGPDPGRCGRGRADGPGPGGGRDETESHHQTRFLRPGASDAIRWGVLEGGPAIILDDETRSKYARVRDYEYFSWRRGGRSDVPRSGRACRGSRASAHSSVAAVVCACHGLVLFGQCSIRANAGGCAGAGPGALARRRTGL